MTFDEWFAQYQPISVPEGLNENGMEIDGESFLFCPSNMRKEAYQQLVAENNSNVWTVFLGEGDLFTIRSTFSQDGDVWGYMLTQKPHNRPKPKWDYDKEIVVFF